MNVLTALVGAATRRAEPEPQEDRLARCRNCGRYYDAKGERCPDCGSGNKLLGGPAGGVDQRHPDE